VFSVLFRVVAAKSADGRPYCRTMPAALALPPKLMGKPPLVAHDGTVPVVRRTCPATVEIGKNVVVPAAD
jgi:hypothetical protein